MQNDLSKKTIIPFATNEGWLGKTFEEIKELCKNSNIKEEMNIVFTSTYQDHKIKNIEEVNSWIERIKN